MVLNLTGDPGTDSARFVSLGGPTYGIAWEAMLKMTEMTQRPAVAYRPLECRHGQMPMIEPGTVAVVLAVRAGARLERVSPQTLCRRGATMAISIRAGAGLSWP